VNGSALDHGEWLEAAIVSGEGLAPGSDARSRIFSAVDADRDGLITRRLLTFTTDHRLSARRTVFELLDSLSFQRSGWLVVADAAEQALKDVDPQVRRTAATVLVSTAEPDRAVAALHALSDPVVRTALVDALLWRKVAGHQHLLEGLRLDPVPAVRLLANVAVFSSADPATWPALDAAIRADLEPCAGTLNAPGSRLILTAGER
jgi:hypothetical protein